MGQQINKDFINDIQTGIGHLEKIQKYCFASQYPQRFLNGYYRENEKMFVQEAIDPTYRYLSSITYFNNKIYPTYIEPILKINAGIVGNHVQYPSEATIESLDNLFEEPLKYKEKVDNARQEIYEKLQKVSDLLYPYINEKHKHLFKDGLYDIVENIRCKKQ
ncbi:MAG: hypothetical protein FWC14_04880 [Candidatus Bathyarchaeota archaeon]|uniref:hypothetical protein n=1 Tax=Candidatus Bathycorpusculum sp. TaxID=2994959 RepID=UPI00282F358B|nr:hypothetical protein [Candidatus Termiticorpusculum sp.]MCL2292360.1 hypothetical protein [Candidatus Termiticorpusculum sp.]